MRARLTKIKTAKAKPQTPAGLTSKEIRQADLIVWAIVILLGLFVVVMGLIYGFHSRLGRFTQYD